MAFNNHNLYQDNYNENIVDEVKKLDFDAGGIDPLKSVKVLKDDSPKEMEANVVIGKGNEMVKCQSKDKKIGNLKKFKGMSTPTALVFAILSCQFPCLLLAPEFVEWLNSNIQSAVQDIPRGNRLPGFIYIIYQAGYCKVRVQDVYTKKWIINKVSTMTFSGMPLMIRSIPCIPKLIFCAVVPGQIPNERSMLTQINHQNKSIRTNLWKIIGRRQGLNEFLAIMEVDAVNAKKIKSMLGVVFVNQQPAQFELVHITNL